MSPVVAVAAHGAWLTPICDGQPIEVPRRDEALVDRDPRSGHPALDQASTQLRVMNHARAFGAGTHEPAAPAGEAAGRHQPGLDTPLQRPGSGCGSRQDGAGSGRMRVGLPGKRRLMTRRGGYHGDTFLAMSIWHSARRHALAVTDVLGRLGAAWAATDHDPALQRGVSRQLAQHAGELAAVVAVWCGRMRSGAMKTN